MRENLIAVLVHRFPDVTFYGAIVPPTPDELASAYAAMADAIERAGLLDVATDAEHAVDLWAPWSALA